MKFFADEVFQSISQKYVKDVMHNLIKTHATQKDPTTCVRTVLWLAVVMARLVSVKASLMAAITAGSGVGVAMLLTRPPKGDEDRHRVEDLWNQFTRDKWDESHKNRQAGVKSVVKQVDEGVYGLEAGDFYQEARVFGRTVESACGLVVPPPGTKIATDAARRSPREGYRGDICLSCRGKGIMRKSEFVADSFKGITLIHCQNFCYFV